ncbi:P-loop NTPase fold protein [uncultured Pelagimonas sp.]|uniref:P-loop NTPase fold protein n=1 Tax=uncultured Pelagimonas sp. TaxID=1618102 RepID=UPI002604394A|nr:P-loop NTPase fold protein [uncultured Pelagimonas sp.]
MSNETDKAVVEAYLKQKDPGYALLIDAPWGAGKTHFIKSVIKSSASDAIYATLYDVHSSDAFDWALVRASNTLGSGRFGKAFDMLTGAVGNTKAGDVNVNLGNLGKAAFTEYALRKLSNTLIFDDIERCGLSHKQLSGLINRFVEHQGKRVLLLANSEKHSDRDSFDTRREKLIGQTVTLKADLDAALVGVWAKITNDQGKAELQARQHLIKETFEEAGHQNLRLILRAVHDCAVMLGALTKEMLEFEESVDRLIRTHLALHMAYHGGEIGKDELSDPPVKWSGVFRDKDEKDSVKPSQHELRFGVVRSNHLKADIETSSGSVFPLELRHALLVDGYAPKEQIRETLAKTNRFKERKKRPDSFRMMNWYDEPVKELTELIARVDSDINRHSIIEPDEILCVFFCKKTDDRTQFVRSKRLC